ncbi:MAG: NFACT RNA binding domain-containing protein [Candidatus Woesearchaeota archaeon]
MVEVEIDTKISIEANASRYFEEAKRFKKKAEGALKALSEAKKRIEEEAITFQKQKEVESRREKKWYEKFRWFISSEGFLVIGGRDATTNDILIKKHMEKHDLVFHAEMAGSPFVLIKTEGKTPGELTIAEAAAETASFSRGWRLGLSEMEVFYVTPEQVSLTPKAGEYMGKGSFMIYGKRNVLRAPLRVAVGIYEGAVMCGPPSAVSKNCPKGILIGPGSEKKTDIAKVISKELNCKIDDVVRELPSGGFRIIKDKHN